MKKILNFKLNQTNKQKIFNTLYGDLKKSGNLKT